MSFQAIKGGMLAFVSGVVILAAALLVILQWGNSTPVTMYGPQVYVNTALLMFCSALGGLVLAGMVKVFCIGARALRDARRQAAAHDVAEAARTLRNRPADANRQADQPPTP